MMGSTMEDRASRLGAVLRKLNESGIEASAVVSRDGIILHSEMQAGEEEKATFAAMAAAMLGAAETATSELKQGVPRHIIVEAGDNKLVEVGAGPVALLVAMVGPKTTLADAMKAIDKAALEVRALTRP